MRIPPGILLLLLCTACARPDAWFDRAPLDPAPEPVPLQAPVPPAAPTPPPTPPVAGDAWNLSLHDTVLAVLAWHPELALRRLDPVVAAEDLGLVRGLYDPALVGRVAFAEERATETARSTGTQFRSDSDETTVGLGLRQRLPTGTDLDLDLSHSRNTSNRTPDQHQTRVGLTLTQALLRDAGPRVAVAEIQRAALEIDISRYELTGYLAALVASTERAYWDLVLARRALAIYEQSVSVAEQELAAIEERVAVGLLAPHAAAVARSEAARRVQDRIDARSAAEASHLRLMRLVAPQVAAPPADEVVLGTEPELGTETAADLADRLALADRERPELAEARLRLRQRRLATVATRDGLRPRLDFFVTLGKSGYGPTAGEAMEDLDDGPGYDLGVGLDLAYSLGARAEQARHQAAVASARQAELAIGNLRRAVALEVHLAALELDRARQQVAASRATVELQEETLRGERERLAVGAGTDLLIAQAARDLLAARIGEVRAAVAWQRARIDLHLAEGSLLARRGISVAP